MILKLENFCNEKGMLVQQRTYISGTKSKFVPFVGTIGVKVQDPNDPNAMQTIEFPIEVGTIEEAFEKFKEAADEKIEKIRKEQEEKITKEYESYKEERTETPPPTSAKKPTGVVVVKKKKGLFLPGNE